jgi:hypothetical protein
MSPATTMTSVLKHTSPEFIPKVEAEQILINLTVSNLYATSCDIQYTFYIESHITIGMFKEYLSPIFFYLPENMDILLSKSMPYPLADKMQISTLHDSDMCDLLMQPCGPAICPCIAYLSINDNKTTIDLQNLSYNDITSLPFWFQSTPIHYISLNADHPRIDEILYKLATIINPHHTTIECITLYRAFPEHHLPLVSNEALTTFYHTITKGMTLNNIALLLDRNIVSNNEMLEFGAWLRIKY